MNVRVVAALSLAFAVQGCGGIVLDHVGVEADGGGRTEPTAVASDAPVTRTVTPPACPETTIHVAPDGPLHGTIENWPAGVVIGFSASGVSFPAEVSHGHATWSLGTLSADGSAGSAYLVETGNTLVASAPSVFDISQITDHVRLDYTSRTTPLVLTHEFAVLHSLSDGLYMALRVDAIRAASKANPACTMGTFGNFTFYIQPNGTTDFSGFAGF